MYDNLKALYLNECKEHNIIPLTKDSISVLRRVSIAFFSEGLNNNKIKELFSEWNDDDNTPYIYPNSPKSLEQERVKEKFAQLCDNKGWEHKKAGEK